MPKYAPNARMTCLNYAISVKMKKYLVLLLNCCCSFRLFGPTIHCVFTQVVKVFSELAAIETVVSGTLFQIKNILNK